MIVFDSHVHLGLRSFYREPGPNEREWPIFNNADENCWQAYSKYAEKNGIFKSLVFPFPFPNVDARRANEYVIDASSRRSDLFLPLLLISDKVQYFERHKIQIAGAKEEFYLPGGRDAKQFMPVYDFLEQENKVLLIHPHSDDRVPRILNIRKQFPKLKIILAHSGRKWPFTDVDVIEYIIPTLCRIKDIFFETSTIRKPDAISKLVSKVGAERVLFGSDIPFYSKKSPHEDVFKEELRTIINAKISNEAKELILRRNFQSLFCEDLWIRRVSRDDYPILAKLIDEIKPIEKKHLAIEKKLKVIKSNVRLERHIFVLENHSGIQGFMRESGRPKNAAMIEEIYVHPSFRGHGLGTKLLYMAQKMFISLEAKTFAENNGMNHLFIKSGFSTEDTSGNKRILKWRWRSA